ncbi:haloacid dehalogenase [Ureibacillus massiliensis 4400831 = CIP 108448 = CCUG 49529]|uniref:Haloacid dehalogenase n=1 Tax=Ureibacillus massiliensis 4400831 = CIP 108448 = CCUG 49529 TaxID=1211035 RepID=A0A0A3IZ96_9BACL|nr:HAD family hydrolase [Ureibacillus massiliensis]KGR90099.1 haloacid dehalogenase [Ureibacillus massiliensis 4400831 = CIP 108448 = CCUG 49529]
MKKVIVFDMDDTLYDEFEFVKSGFRAVSTFLNEQFGIIESESYQWMWNRLQKQGRGAIFDDLLKEYGLYKKTLAKKCVSIYRLHKPTIQLPNETIEVLKQLENFPLYLVTDGNKIVQNNKVQALELEKYMNKCFITYRYGLKHSKPSPHCFQLIAKQEKVEPEHIVYIGDNPSKDFVGIKPLGFRTIRIMTGQHVNKQLPEEFEADIRIQYISELPNALKKLWPEIEV